MIRLLDTQLGPVARLSRAPEGLALVDVLEGEIKKIQDVLLTVPHEKLEVFQGRAQALRDVVEMVRSASAILDKPRAR